MVRLGRALLPGEVHVRLFLLRIGETEVIHPVLHNKVFHISILHTTIPQFCKPLMDSIITKGMTVLDFKKQIIKEAYNQGVEYPLQLDRYTPHTSQGVSVRHYFSFL